MSHLVHGINLEGNSCWFLDGDLLSHGEDVELLESGQWTKAKFNTIDKMAFLHFRSEIIEISPFSDITIRKADKDGDFA